MGLRKCVVGSPSHRGHIGDSSSLVAKFAIRRDAHLHNTRLAEVKRVDF